MRRIKSALVLKCAAALATAALLAPAAHAVDRDPDSFVWIFSDTGFQSQASALGLSRGLAWPVIFGEDTTIALFPTSGNTGGNDYWNEIGPGVGFNPKAASTIDGRVAGAGQDTQAPAYVLSPTGAANYLPQGTNSVAFSNGGALVYSNFDNPNNRVTGFSYPTTAPVYDVAVSPFGDAGALTGNEFYSTLTGDFEDFDFNTPLPYTGEGELTFDAQGRPHIIDREAKVFSFDTTAGQWSMADLGVTFGGAPTSTIAADSTGTVGAAFVNSSFELIYAYWTNSAGWQSMVVDTGVQVEAVGLEFDYDDLPVISYSKGGTLRLAYDPIVAVPEPASFVLLGGLGVLTLGRRRRAA